MTSSFPATVVSLRPAGLADALFGPGWPELRRSGTLLSEAVITDHAEAPELLAEAEVLITGWGTPPLTADRLAAMPRLRAVLHSAGATDFLFPDGLGERRLRVSNAGDANGVPVAEFTVAMIILGRKDTFGAQRRYREARAAVDRDHHFADVGSYGTKVGLVSASRIGRRVATMLQGYDVEVWMHDPYLTEEDAAALGVRPVGLDELMAGCDVVSLHTPVLPETRGLIGAEQLALLRDGTVLINTARGVIIDEPALVTELGTGRFRAILDVTYPEPPAQSSPLWQLDNVWLTPHIAGSMGDELGRLGATAAGELARYAAGEPLAYPDALWGRPV